MRGNFLYLVFVISLSIFFSCKKDDLKAPLASFLVVKNPTLKTTNSQGNNHHKITDIWYYVDGEFKGVFPLGSVMPIVKNDKAEITLFAGIKNNGITATRVPYVFYDALKFTQNLESGKTYTILPEFEYTSSAVFAYAQNFDSPGSQFMSAGDSAYMMITDPSKTFGGIGGSIFMSMNDVKPTSKMLQTVPYYLPSGGVPIYLELNYKCNQSVQIGVIGGGVDERPAITLNPTSDWNKIYIQLTSVVSAQPTYAGYQVFIKAKKEVEKPEIYIDNVKLIIQ